MALGDSVTVGVGDMTAYGWRGWAGVLAESLGSTYALRYTNLARIGATSQQVRNEQLPAAIGLRPQLASVLVGINDTMRSTFDPGRVRADLFAVAEGLTASGACLLTVRFHDHGRVFGLPGVLRDPLARRIDAVNAAYDEIHEVFGGIQIDLAARPDVYARAAWSIDRLHPSERGHRALARTFADLLPGVGFRLTVPDLEPEGGALPSRRADLTWMVGAGLPWVGRRARDLVPWALRLALSEAGVPFRRRGVRA